MLVLSHLRVFFSSLCFNAPHNLSRVSIFKSYETVLITNSNANNMNNRKHANCIKKKCFYAKLKAAFTELPMLFNVP